MKALVKRKKNESKMDAARRLMNIVFKEEEMDRKDILPILIEKAELTEKAAPTYYAMIKKEIEEEEGTDDK